MGDGLILVLVVAFVAVVFLVEGLFMIWDDKRSPEVLRLQRRLRNLSAGSASQRGSNLLREVPATPFQAFLLALPRVGSLNRMIQQAGKEFTVTRLLLIMLALLVAGVLSMLLVKRPMVVALGLGLILAALPLLWLVFERNKRLNLLQSQLPDAIDLMARSLKAGHAFPSALSMVAEEGPDPLAQEFRVVHDELNFGLPMDDALRSMAQRVPVDDVRFFVIAVLLQRETGGNLAEVLGNIARLVRDRFKLLGKVKVLAAEGKMSAWILGVMPFVLAFLLNIVNPKLMSILWTDPAGLKALYVCAGLYVVGILWMWRLVKLRV